jgi:hypothetical protein
VCSKIVVGLQKQLNLRLTLVQLIDSQCNVYQASSFLSAALLGSCDNDAVADVVTYGGRMDGNGFVARQ